MNKLLPYYLVMWFFIVNLLKDVDSIIRADLYLAKRFVVFEATLIDPVAMIQ